MKNKRRDFLKLTGMTGLGLATGGLSNVFGATLNYSNAMEKESALKTAMVDDKTSSVIGAYGKWAAGLTGDKLPALSFRKKEFTNIDAWRKDARKRLAERLAIPDIGGMPNVIVKKQYAYDGLHIEELSWQLPYGAATEAILLKPMNAKGKLPGILAFHDHGGVKYFGTRKITRTSDVLHPLMAQHQKDYYEDLAWANEVAKRGYVVLVSDAFPFASRRVLMNDVAPETLRHGLNDDDPENSEHIEACNKWASDHEHIMSKSLLSAGTTWPGVFFAEDKKALDILCSRPDVDVKNVGCCGLSGGGMRTVFMGGQDDRIKCAVCVGFMTTWKDFVLNKSVNHTWMTYVPLLPNELDFPEILGLRAPLPTMVLNDTEDELYTLDEMKSADRILTEVYSKAGATDHYKCNYYPGPHKFDKKMQADAFNWFDKWLKG
ncbi:Tat (twin-arginine translocation) pathway signal sequence [Chryseolinea serpens]|uniref:Tat (Twin-arginine translocation) pathway signal sequence n=1 Tax=Chryseolinea serpens TaxID=947013 RepID=A0A1M5P3S2_9BACT|nr:alpha/beta hydrolase family protein [Chryseolinea serpens]SHG96357.1 Tat (twin-arginine translocation) pathway signal sequence [Chryseolinea serpens]